MKQSIGLKAAVAAIIGRYKIKEGLARRLARAEVRVLQEVYPQLKNASEDQILTTRYASGADAVNILRDIHIPAIVHLAGDTIASTEYKTIVREVMMKTDVEEADLDFEQIVERPNAADIERVRASYDKRNQDGTGGLFRVEEFREAFHKFEQGLISEAELREFANNNEMVKYRIQVGDYGEETEEMERAAGEPTIEKWLKMHPDAKVKGINA